MYVPSQVRKKLDEKAIKCIFLGIDVRKNGYKCFDIDDEKFYISKYVKFDEMQNRKTLECDVQMPLSCKLSSMDHENDVDTENEKIDG